MGFVRVHLLYHASIEPIFGAEMIDELQRHGYSMSAGTLYPILHSMEKAGCLTSENRVVRGKRRKYYTLTARGTEVLSALQKQVQELVHEITPTSPKSPNQNGHEEAK
jgi:DNA-binding PadR family transcriptional regulator